MESDPAVTGLQQADRPFVCETCPKKYLRKNNLEDHVLMEHPDTEQVGRETGENRFRQKCRRQARDRQLDT